MFKLILLIIPFVLFASKPNLLLLKTYKNQDISGWVMSEKLDGIRAYWNGKELLTRKGNKIYAPKWFIESLPPFELDGELWTKQNDFENISSIVMDKKPSNDWKYITYNIFEVPNAKGDLHTRLEKVKRYENRYLKVIEQIEIKDKEHFEAFHNFVKSNKGEGIVVRDPNKPYINKRTKYALKVKSFQDEECEVIEHIKGKGKFTNILGAIKCKMKNGMVIKIGSGFTNQQRNNPPKIGDIITFKYNGFTKYNKPRFPVFLRVRYSK